jgi:hypothetical protein
VVPGTVWLAVHGHGVVLEFMVEDYDEVVQRARSVSAEMLGESAEMLGEDTFPDGTRAFSPRDPAGYVVVLAGAPPPPSARRRLD